MDMQRFLRRPRGFTLIELMLAVGIASIVGTTFFGVMFMQTISYVQKLDELDAHSSARAALNVIRRYARNARWGMVTGLNGLGTVGIGKCYNSSNPALSTGACNNLSTDSGSDRMRAVYIVYDTEYVSNPPNGSYNSCASGAYDSPAIHVNQNPAPGRQFVAGAILGIGGNCVNGTTAADALIYQSDAVGSGGCSHRYSVQPLEGSGLSCGAQGYAQGFNFGRAVVADFYIFKDASNRPQLMMRTDPTKQPSQGYIVAFDVEDMQVSYGLDTTDPTDRSVDVWCDDPRITADGGACDTKRNNTGTAIPTAENYNRIVAVKVALRVRTDNTRPNLNVLPLDPNMLLANPVANPQDGYQRWIYTTTIALRNDNI